MNPYCVEIDNVIDLYQLKDGRFQLMSGENPTPIMSGYKYFIFRDDKAELLKAVGVEGAQFERAIIWDRKNDIEYTNFQKLIVFRHFDSETMDDIAFEGSDILCFENRYLFVTQELKVNLINSGMGVNFTEGFSRFGG